MGRCTAKSKRSGNQCKNWAIRKKTKCRFHGGKSTGPRTKTGKEKSRQAHLKHGFRSKQYQEELKIVRNLIKCSKDNLFNL
jgi:hypothetical protein